jgi:CHASE3 domain sensor protein
MYLKVAQYQREQREDKKLLSELAELSLTAPGLKKELASAKQRAQTELRQSQQTLAKVQVKQSWPI